MRPSRHLAVSSTAGAALWAATGEPLTLPLTVATGVLIDLDHVPDLLWNRDTGHKARVTSALHAWEWLAGLLVIGIVTGFPWWVSAILVGYGLHLLTDHLFNQGGTWVYFLVYRASHGFRADRMVPHWEVHHSYRVILREIPFAVRLWDWCASRIGNGKAA